MGSTVHEFASQRVNLKETLWRHVAEMKQAPTTCLVKLETVLLNSAPAECVEAPFPDLCGGKAPSVAPKSSRYCSFVQRRAAVVFMIADFVSCFFCTTCQIIEPTKYVDILSSF